MHIRSIWTSFIMRTILILQHNMWLSRSLVVHLFDNKDLETDNKYADNDIKTEFKIRLWTITTKNATPVSREHKIILEKSLDDKIKWLVSV